ncbi:hypothetical protein AB6A23_25215 [Paenibacillus tarimensis]
MWKIRRVGHFAQIGDVFDRFVDEFLAWITTEPQVSYSMLEERIYATDTPLCRVMRACPKLRNCAIELVLHPKREEVAAAYYEMLDKYTRLVDGTLHIECPNEIAADCFEYFYDELIETVSFRNEYLPNISEETKRAFRRDFGMQIKSCPYCDLKYIPFHGDTSIDHFLTKTKVQLLAIHSENLVTSCTACNDRLKNQQLILPMVHPFLYQAADKINIRFQLTLPPYEINLVVTETDTFEKTRLTNYFALFDLQAQYKERTDKMLGERQDIRREVVHSYKSAALPKPVLRHRVSDMLDSVLASRRERWRKLKGRQEFVKLYLDYYAYLQTPNIRSRLLQYIISELEN